MPAPRRLPLLAAATAFATALAGQPMTLREVVDRAVAQSLIVDGAEQRLSASRVELRRSELARYPSLAFQSGGGFQFGLNVDPTTNLLEQQTIGFTNFSLDAGATLYAGGRLRNAVKRDRAGLAAAEAELAAARQDIALQTTQLYLEALLATEAVGNAENLRDQAASRLRTITGRVGAGQAAPADQLQPEAELARQEQAVVSARNARELARLNLEQLLRLPPGERLELSAPETLGLDAVALADVTPAELYAAAAERQPDLRAARLGEEAARYDVEVAKAGYRPTVSAFGQANTRYSSQAIRRAADDGPPVIESQTVIINGQEVELGFPQPNIRLEDIPLTDQLSDFFGQAVGLNLRVPIFSQGLNDASRGLAEARAEQARIDRERAELELRTATEQALAGARNARAEVAAARRALDAAERAYAAAQRRTELGAGTGFDITDQRLLLEQAQITLLRARYQYVFNAKVVDFYLGRPLEL